MRGETANLLLGLGIVGATGYLLVRHASRSALLELRSTVPSAPSPLPPATPTPPVTPSRLAEPFSLVPGARYVAAINVSFPLSAATSASDVAKEAHGLGFADATATRQRPSSPAIAAGDYYITATYSGPPRVFPRSNARGLVTIQDAWRIA